MYVNMCFVGVVLLSLCTSFVHGDVTDLDRDAQELQNKNMILRKRILNLELAKESKQLHTKLEALEFGEVHAPTSYPLNVFRKASRKEAEKATDSLIAAFNVGDDNSEEYARLMQQAYEQAQRHLFWMDYDKNILNKLRDDTTTGGPMGHAAWLSMLTKAEDLSAVGELADKALEENGDVKATPYGEKIINDGVFYDVLKKLDADPDYLKGVNRVYAAKIKEFKTKNSNYMEKFAEKANQFVVEKK